MNGLHLVYDACALYPNLLRDVLIRLHIHGLVRARWTERILDETFRNLAQNRPDLPAEKLARTRKLMCDAIPDVLVEGYEPLEPAFDLPDPDDCHVLAAAVKAGAQVIVTENLRDFPDYGLSPWGVEAKAPDDFLVDQYHLDRVALRNIVDDIVATRARGDSFDDVLAELRSNGLAQTASLLGYGV